MSEKSANINNKRKNKYNKCVLKCVYSQEEEKSVSLKYNIYFAIKNMWNKFDITNNI